MRRVLVPVFDFERTLIRRSDVAHFAVRIFSEFDCDLARLLSRLFDHFGFDVIQLGEEKGRLRRIVAAR